MLLWCATAALTALDLLVTDDGRWGNLAIVTACGAMTFALCRVIRSGFREMNETFERTLGKAYELGRRAERRENESRHLAAVQEIVRK